MVAKGKGVEVKRSQLDDEVIRLKAQAAGARPDHPAGSTGACWTGRCWTSSSSSSSCRPKPRRRTRPAGKAQAEKRFADAKTKLGSEEAAEPAVDAHGHHPRRRCSTKWTESATAEAVLKRELKVNITDADAKKYYDDNPARFEQPEMVRASHILLMTTDPKTNTELTEDQKAAKHKEMEGILKRARAGEDFAKLAKEYSEDPGSKDKGGEYKFPRGQMVPEFEAAAFSLNTNQVSDIVTTRFGYHIIKLRRRFRPRKSSSPRRKTTSRTG